MSYDNKFSTVPQKKATDNESQALFNMTFQSSLQARALYNRELKSGNPYAKIVAKQSQSNKVPYGANTYSDLTSYNNESRLKPF